MYDQTLEWLQRNSWRLIPQRFLYLPWKARGMRGYTQQPRLLVKCDISTVFVTMPASEAIGREELAHQKNSFVTIREFDRNMRGNQE